MNSQMQNLMAQAQRMQKDITKKQEEIYKTTYKGESEWVEVVFTGKKELVSMTFKYNGDLNEDKEMLQDMISLAIKDAFSKIEKDISNKLGMYNSMLGGLM